VSMLAIVLVREGVLPAGADEATAEAGGNVALVGTGLDAVEVSELVSARSISLVGCQWSDRVDAAHQAVAALGASVVIVPSSPDGRDLAPRLASRLGYPLLAGAIGAEHGVAQLSRVGGRVIEQHRIGDTAVITLIPGLRGSSPSNATPTIRTLTITVPNPPASSVERTVRTVAVLPPDAATMDLAEAPRIVGGGQGLKSAEKFDQLGRVGAAIGASLGGTRVASDAGWIPFERQIGTTGVAVNPRLYLAFAISGATQHVSGLGNPDHIISVNTDSSCPMMNMADLAITADANAVLDALERRLVLVDVNQR
jgi:electron transfer flavoprotein alpha subunit